MSFDVLRHNKLVKFKLHSRIERDLIQQQLDWIFKKKKILYMYNISNSCFFIEWFRFYSFVV